jgi:hypothetical protein
MPRLRTAGAAVCTCCALLGGAASAHAGTATFTATALGETPFKVPKGVTSVQIVATGAAGEKRISLGFAGGVGAQVSGSLGVAPQWDQVLYLEVGIAGGLSPNHFGGHGGGSSEVRLCGATEANCFIAGPGVSGVQSQVLVAAGGGGSGAFAPGAGDTSGGAGGAGGLLGANGGDGQTRDSGGGGGATPFAGGAGGTPAAGGTVGDGGQRGLGGGGGAGSFPAGNSGGGGGGGYFGGGGGGGGGNISTRTGGGGGGSSFARSITLPDALTATTIDSPTSQPAVGAPQIALTYTDAQAPQVALTAPADNAQAGGRPTFSGTGGTDTGDSATVTVTLTPQGGAPTVLTTARDAQGAWSVTPSSPLAAGTYSVVASQPDNAGNTGSTPARSLTIDTAPPAVTLDQPAQGSLTANAAPVFTGAAATKPKDLPDVTVSVYSGASASGSPLRTLHATAAGGKYSSPAGTPLADGTYTAVATESDNGQQTGTSAPHTFTVDTRAPTIDISAPVEGRSYGRGAAILAVYSCQDAAGTGIATCGGPPESGQAIDTNTAGAHAFTVTSTDRAGNSASRTVHYTVSAEAAGARPLSGLGISGVTALRPPRGCPPVGVRLVRPKSKAARSCAVRVVVRGAIDARAIGARLTLRATAGRRHASATIKLKGRRWTITLRLPGTASRWRLTASFPGNGSLRLGTTTRSVAITQR